MIMMFATFGAIGLLCSTATANPFWSTAPKEHIVMFNRDVPADFNVTAFVDLHRDLDTRMVRHWYRNTGFQGFSIPMSDEVARDIAKIPGVAHVRRSVPVRHAQVQAHDSSWAPVRAMYNCTWGQQRISGSEELPYTNLWLGYTKYISKNGLGGFGADIYIIDTGVNVQHIALQDDMGNSRANAVWSYDATNFADLNGHGTHVAGTAAGRRIGAAASAQIHSVRALDASGSGDSASIVAAINQVINLHVQRRSLPGFVGSVINLSLESTGSGGLVVEVDTAVGAAVQAGIHVVVAAGNNNGDNACKYTPASTAGLGGKTIAVGALARDNSISDFSNTGPCVDVYAPGELIYSSWYGPGNNAVSPLSGTSMAAPHVSGIIAALMVQFPNLAQDPAGMKAQLLALALPNVVTGNTNGGGRPLLAYSGAWGHGV